MPIRVTLLLAGALIVSACQSSGTTASADTNTTATAATEAATPTSTETTTATATATASADAPQQSTVAMSCDQIETELAAVNATIESIGTYETEVLATNIGTGIAGHAVGLAGAPLLGSLINSAGGVANMNAARRQEVKREAELRKSTLEGLYMGRGCTA